MKVTPGLTFRSVKMHRRMAVAMVAGGLVLAGTVVAAPAQATFPGGNGRIAFVRGGNIYTANAWGGSIRQITKAGGMSAPRWSPDGKRLTYENSSGNVLVRTMATGKTVSVGTADPGTAGPEWSGDGTRIAWVGTIPNPDNECPHQGIYTAPPNGSAAPTLLYDLVDVGGDVCAHPARFQIGGWSPDSATILITACSVAGSGVGCDLWKLDVATAQAGQEALTELIGVFCDADDPNCIFPDMSPATFGPKGIRVFFSAAGGDPGQLPNISAVTRIYSIDNAGTNLHQVSTAKSGYDPTASPNGTSVLFTKNACTTTNIMKSGVNATSTPRVLIKNAAQADWQPTH